MNTLSDKHELTKVVTLIHSKHKDLLLCFEELRKALSHTSDRHVINRKLGMLSKCMKGSIYTQEYSMEVAEYPSIDSHTAEHQELLSDLGSLNDSLSHDMHRHRFIEELNILEKKFLNHIIHQDKRFFVFSKD